MPSRVKTIEIRAFRGIPELDIPLDGKNLLISGDNGTGKSSIVEAFEYFFTGSVSHLEGIQGLSFSRHGPHVRFATADVNIAVAFDPGNVRLLRTPVSEPAPPKHLSQYLASAKAGSFILRRSQVLAFIASQPADRFRALASILGVDSLDQVELEMMRARDDLSGEFQAQTQAIARLLQVLSTDLRAPITGISDVLPALNSTLADAGLPLLDSLDQIGPHAERMLKAVKSAADVEAVSSLDHALTQAKGLPFSTQFLPALRELSQEADPLIDQGARLEMRLADILRAGGQLIEAERLEECPLCAQPITRDTLLELIAARLKKLQALSEPAGRVRTTSTRLMSEIGDAKRRALEVQATLAKHPSVSIPSIEAVLASRFFPEAESALKQTAALEASLPLQTLGELVVQINTACASVATEIATEIAKLGVTEQERRLLEMVRLVASTKDRVAEFARATDTQSDLREMLNTAVTIFDTFSETKKRKVTQLYTRIEGDVRTFYSILHPGEPHADISLRLSTSKRASTELRVSSFGRADQDPRALTSEGHLDSLGLCIFLAFIKNFHGDCTLVVLDDVITTIDSGHRGRLCDLLFGEFKDYQLIITTHDGPWCQELVAAQRAFKLDGTFINAQITRWDLDVGPCIARFMPRIERIEERLAACDKTGAANLSRQYLEWGLKGMAINSNAPVPVANWQSGTVRDLEPHSRKRITSLISDKDYVSRLEAAFQELEKTVIFGNLLSHDNPLADQVVIAEVTRFYTAIRELHRLVSCPACETLLEYVKDAKEYRCTNARCKSPKIVATR
jgi:recombinational DNA repair ATPase RecF